MELSPMSPKQQSRRIVTNRSFWIVAAMLAAIAFLHYSTPQIRLLSPQVDVFLSRHAVERIIFILPIAGATFAFGQAGGLVTLALAVLAMLPRVIWLSFYPVDAAIETAATGVVGYLVVWMIETQEREKRLRQKAVEELETVNAIATTVSQSLDLDEILDRALGKVLEASEVAGLESRGGIFLLHGEGQNLHLEVHRGWSSELVRQGAEVVVREHLPGLLADSGQVFFSADSPERSQHARELEPHVIVPLKARDRVLGVMLLSLREGHHPSDHDRQLLASIGSQVGMAVENARLYENLRFYVREITRAQENERKRIAQELHDETLQMLIVISRRLEALSTLPEQLPESALRHLEQLQQLTGDSLRGTRSFVQDLRPPILDHLGLVAALEGLTGGLAEKDGVEVKLEVAGEVRRLVPEEELVLFRIAQEALNNVRRHSGASRAAVQVEFYPARVRMSVSDNGRGFNAPERIGDLAATGRLGLIGMHERARTLGGTLLIQAAPGRGTTVIVDVPVQPEPSNKAGDN